MAIPTESSSITRSLRTSTRNADCVKILVAPLLQIGQSQMFSSLIQILMVACSILRDLTAEMSTLMNIRKGLLRPNCAFLALLSRTLHISRKDRFLFSGIHLHLQLVRFDSKVFFLISPDTRGAALRTEATIDGTANIFHRVPLHVGHDHPTSLGEGPVVVGQSQRSKSSTHRQCLAPLYHCTPNMKILYPRMKWTLR